MKIIFQFLFLAITLSACVSDSAASAEVIDQAPTAKPQYLITNGGILGISPGHYIGDHLSILRETTANQTTSAQKTYSIVTENGKRIGVIHTRKDEPTIIDRITVTYADAVTEQGIKVGWKLAAVKRLFPEATSQRMYDKKGFTQLTHQGLRYEFKTLDDQDVFDQAIIDETSYLYSVTILP